MTIDSLLVEEARRWIDERESALVTHPSRELWNEYAAGRLGEEEDRLQEHLVSCRRCSDLLLSLGRRERAVERAKAWLEAALESRKGTPECYLLAARAAAFVAEALPPGAAPPADLRDLQARAHAEVGNALRLLARFRDSEAAFGTAMARAGADVAPETLAHLLNLSGSLAIDRRDFAEADQRLRLSVQLYERLGDRYRALDVFLRRGLVAANQENHELAIHHNCRVFDRLAPDRDARLAYISLYNSVCALMQIGAFEPAASLFEQGKPFFESHASEIEKVKIRWNEARAALGLGRFRQAEELFRKVRLDFERLELPCYVAYAGLDLAEICLREGRFVELRALAAEILGVFSSIGVQREALAALVFLEQAARRERVTLDLVRAAVREVEALEASGSLNGAAREGAEP
ncbi:MAG TPA: hypothetical protein VN783_08820 [Thermoanaerobaculia bacterium]|nr:hypothetical protein [Thermoanaerobaculia bacterium]